MFTPGTFMDKSLQFPWQVTCHCLLLKPEREGLAQGQPAGFMPKLQLMISQFYSDEFATISNHLTILISATFTASRPGSRHKSDHYQLLLRRSGGVSKGLWGTWLLSSQWLAFPLYESDPVLYLRGRKYCSSAANSQVTSVEKFLSFIFEALLETSRDFRSFSRIPFTSTSTAFF